MPPVGFEFTIPVSDQAKAFNALDRAAIVSGIMTTIYPENEAEL
jgi:hypothetical protein